jgi:hypothetical protein
MATIAKSLPIPQNLTIRHDGTFSFRYRVLDPDGVTPVNNTGWQVDLYLRKTVSGAILHQFSTVTGEIAVSGATGYVTVTLDLDEIAAIDPGNYVYDIRETYTDDTVAYRFKGSVTVEQMVTRDA